MLSGGGKFDCTFETGFCTWTQGAGAKFNWTRQQGKTGSPNTGPSEDHTLKHGMFLSSTLTVKRIKTRKETNL